MKTTTMPQYRRLHQHRRVWTSRGCQLRCSKRSARKHRLLGVVLSFLPAFLSRWRCCRLFLLLRPLDGDITAICCCCRHLAPPAITSAERRSSPASAQSSGRASIQAQLAMAVTSIGAACGGGGRITWKIGQPRSSILSSLPSPYAMPSRSSPTVVSRSTRTRVWWCAAAD